LAAAIKSAQLHAKVLELSLGDSLTGVYNRRYFEILLPKEVNRCRRYGRDLAVIIADIDRFKDYIDAFGRLAGDDALREITRCVLNHARRGLDVITRYGGEEFAVILPETDARGAWEVAEAIRQDVAEDGCFLRKTTVSLGIAALHGDELSPQLLVEQADRALYQAKSRGRNRAVRFEPRMPESAPSAASGIRSTNGA
jgi:diguanylate cyclase (GGDEF)-like protein